MRFFERVLNDWLGRAVDILCILTLSVLVAIVFINVVFRYFLHLPVAWSAELAQILLVWLTFFGSIAAIRRNRHLKVEDLFKRLSPKGQSLLYRVVNTVAGVFMGVMVWKGIEMTIQISGQLTDALEVSQAVFYIPIPLGFALMFPYAAYNVASGMQRNGSEEVK